MVVRFGLFAIRVCFKGGLLSIVFICIIWYIRKGEMQDIVIIHK